MVEITLDSIVEWMSVGYDKLMRDRECVNTEVLEGLWKDEDLVDDLLDSSSRKKIYQHILNWIERRKSFL